jgi:hypothetical protein
MSKECFYMIRNLYSSTYMDNRVIVRDMKMEQEILRLNKINFKTTEDIKEMLQNEGFKWNKDEKEWTSIKENENETKKLVDKVQRFIIEVLPQTLKHCWECPVCGGMVPNTYNKCDCQDYELKQ